MTTKKKTASNQEIGKLKPQNPTDPNLLARDVMEAFLGEPIIQPSRKKPTHRKPSKKK